MDFQGKKHILSYIRSACDEFGMIADGDRIAVGVSGGKDSLTLLCALAELRRFYPHKFELCAITIDMGFGEIGRVDFDTSAIAALCESLGVRYEIVKTHMARVIFEDRHEKNPCSLCSNMRRGILHNAAVGLGCNKVALGHHFDDIIETFFLNLIHEGRLATFLPVTHLSRRGIDLIRPMIFIPEKEIRAFAQLNALPVFPSPCPADGNTQREAVKQLLHGLEREYKGLKHRVFGAIRKGGLLEKTEEDDN
jgi:Predicted ATPase of the PP-loop superfamily implicated in cell cycle control